MPVPGPRLRGSPQANRPSSERSRGHGRPIQNIHPSLSTMNGPGYGQYGKLSQALGYNTSCSGALSVNDIYETRQSSTDPNEPTIGANPRPSQPALRPSLNNPFTTQFLQETAQTPPPSFASVNLHLIAPSDHVPESHANRTSNPYSPGRHTPQRTTAPPTTTPPAWSVDHLYNTPHGAYEPHSTPIIPATPLAWPDFLFPDHDDRFDGSTFADLVADPDASVADLDGFGTRATRREVWP